MDGAIIIVDATKGVDSITRDLYARLKTLEVPLAFILQGVKGAEQEDPGLQTGDESGAALLI